MSNKDFAELTPTSCVNEVDLIKEVQKRPVLYDKSTNSQTRKVQDAWKEIGDTLQVSDIVCKKRWRSLRDSFIKMRRTRGDRTSTWPYAEDMAFLIPYVDHG